MKKIKLNDMPESDARALESRQSDLVQIAKLELEIAFNGLFTTQEPLPPQRIADAVKEILRILLHVPATGADTHLREEHHKETCATKTHPMGAFALCNCGAYGPEGPPRNFWSLVAKMTQVRVVETEVYEIEKGETDGESS